MDVVFWLVVVGLILLMPTAYAAKIGAPYAPTFIAAIKHVFDFIKLGEKDVMIDLGAGDGKVLIEANKRGARAIGYELSPIMAFVAWIRTWRKKGVSIKMKNFYKQNLPPETTIIFAFLLPENMKRLENYLKEQDTGKVRYVVIYSFPFKDIEPFKIIPTDKCGRMFVYEASNFKMQK